MTGSVAGVSGLTLRYGKVTALDDVSAPPLGYPEAGWAQRR